MRSTSRRRRKVKRKESREEEAGHIQSSLGSSLEGRAEVTDKSHNRVIKTSKQCMSMKTESLGV